MPGFHDGNPPSTSRQQSDMQGAITTTSYPSTLEPAHALLKSLSDCGITDRLVARGRPLKRVTDRQFTAARKKVTNLTKRKKELEARLKGGHRFQASWTDIASLVHGEPYNTMTHSQHEFTPDLLKLSSAHPFVQPPFLAIVL